MFFYAFNHLLFVLYERDCMWERESEMGYGGEQSTKWLKRINWNWYRFPFLDEWALTPTCISLSLLFHGCALNAHLIQENCFSIIPLNEGERVLERFQGGVKYTCNCLGLMSVYVYFIWNFSSLVCP
jgi:hypothetical protein